MSTSANSNGHAVTRISGPIVMARGMRAASMYEVVQVGELGLIGEVVRLDEDLATIQVYEDTTMLNLERPFNARAHRCRSGLGRV